MLGAGRHTCLLWGYHLQVLPSVSHPLCHRCSAIWGGAGKGPRFGVGCPPAHHYDLFFISQPDHLKKKKKKPKKKGFDRCSTFSALTVGNDGLKAPIWACCCLPRCSTLYLASPCLKPSRVNSLQQESAVWWQTRTPSGPSVQGTAVLSVGLLDFSCVLNTPHQIGSHIGSEKKKL